MPFWAHKHDSSATEGKKKSNDLTVKNDWLKLYYSISLLPSTENVWQFFHYYSHNVFLVFRRKKCQNFEVSRYFITQAIKVPEADEINIINKTKWHQKGWSACHYTVTTLKVYSFETILDLTPFSPISDHSRGTAICAKGSLQFREPLTGWTNSLCWGQNSVSLGRGEADAGVSIPSSTLHHNFYHVRKSPREQPWPRSNHSCSEDPLSIKFHLIPEKVQKNYLYFERFKWYCSSFLVITG